MSIPVIVEDGVAKLPPDTAVPNGTRGRLVLESDSDETLAQRYASLIGFTDELPNDMARNHDHYLHGAARKE